MSKASNHKMVRVPTELADRIEAIQSRLLLAVERGQTDRVQVTEQGNKGEWISKAEVIRLALDELEDKWNRSRKASKSRSNVSKLREVSNVN